MKQKEIPYAIRIRMQQAKSNSYHRGYSDGYNEAMKLVKDTDRIIENCDLAIKNIDNHYRYIISSLDRAKNNQFTDISLFYDEGEWHTKLEVGIIYRHSGSCHEVLRKFPFGYEMSLEELLKLYNELLEQMIKNHSREVKNGGVR